jgi:hypothetical protein
LFCETTMMEGNYTRLPCCAPYSTTKSSMALPENARGNTLCGNEGIADMRQLANDRHSIVSFCVTCCSIVRHLLMPFLDITLHRTLRSALIYSNLGLYSSLGYEQVSLHVLSQFGDARSSLSYSDAHQLNT